MNSQARLDRWRGIALFYRKPGWPLARLLHGADLLHEALVPARLERLLRVDVLKVRGGVRGLPGDDVEEVEDLVCAGRLRHVYHHPRDLWHSPLIRAHQRYERNEAHRSADSQPEPPTVGYRPHRRVSKY